MPNVPGELTKVYYTIGEVAEMFEVNTSLIRFWEKEFDVIKPRKNKKGNRLFTPEDIAYIQKIFELVKKQGFTLDGAKQKLKESGVDLSENDEICRKLLKIREELIKIRGSL